MGIGKTNALLGMPKSLRGTVYTFDFTGEVQEFTVPCAGIYEIECAGAGSSANGSTAKARVKLRRKDKLYVYVGGQNNTFNGGGSGASASGTESTWSNATNGCGASDVRTIKHTEGYWFGQDSLLSRIVTAGGSGGSGSYRSYGQDYRHWTDEYGYNRCDTYWKESTGSFSSESVENSNNILCLGSTASVYAGSSQYWEHSHGGDYPYEDGNTISGTWYASGGSAAGGGGYYGGTNGRTGTSYVNESSNINGRSLKVSDVSYDKCNHTGNGYVTITCIK